MMENGRITKWMDGVSIFKILGIYYYKNGDKYEGEFEDSQKNGNGNINGYC